MMKLWNELNLRLLRIKLSLIVRYSLILNVKYSSLLTLKKV